MRTLTAHIINTPPDYNDPLCPRVTRTGDNA
jgi:hypothetical protein